MVNKVANWAGTGTRKAGPSGAQSGAPLQVQADLTADPEGGQTGQGRHFPLS